ncbi:hypothetical protein NPX13_g9075 [Xylaria arbuscula]|uniref:Flavodoxin-like domain-containing protein n=1 Tax=Xylaria arbuscula TaxID=114810 RepID=A0A9W8N793_9PEZI|nr:hypothetical protein NPX13_g9075 [Xylaria arbuscula]
MASNQTLASNGPQSSEGILEFWHAHREIIVVVGVCLCSSLYMLYSALPTKRVVKKPQKRAVVAASTTPVAITTAIETSDAPREVSPQGASATGPRRIKGELRKPEGTRRSSGPDSTRRTQVLVFYSSLTTTTEKIANDFAQSLEGALRGDAERKLMFLSPSVLDLAQIDYDEYFISPPKPIDSTTPVDYFYLFLIPSYNIDSINDNLLEHLQETHHDFRIDTAPLSGLLGYSVFGLGDREGWPTEEEGFCFQAKEVDRWMAKLTGEWAEGVTDVLKVAATTGSLGEGVPGSGDADESDFEYASGEDDDEVLVEGPTATQKKTKKKPTNIDDVEDLGRIMKSNQPNSKGSAPIAVDFTTYSKTSVKRAPQAIKEMVPKSSPTHTALTKQGYTIVGSHSGVKILYGDDSVPIVLK